MHLKYLLLGLLLTCATATWIFDQGFNCTDYGNCTSSTLPVLGNWSYDWDIAHRSVATTYVGFPQEIIGSVDYGKLYWEGVLYSGNIVVTIEYDCGGETYEKIIYSQVGTGLHCWIAQGQGGTHVCDEDHHWVKDLDIFIAPTIETDPKIKVYISDSAFPNHMYVLNDTYQCGAHTISPYHSGYGYMDSITYNPTTKSFYVYDYNIEHATPDCGGGTDYDWFTKYQLDPSNLYPTSRIQTCLGGRGGANPNFWTMGITNPQYIYINDNPSPTSLTGYPVFAKVSFNNGNCFSAGSNTCNLDMYMFPFISNYQYLVKTSITSPSGSFHLGDSCTTGAGGANPDYRYRNNTVWSSQIVSTTTIYDADMDNKLEDSFTHGSDCYAFEYSTYSYDKALVNRTKFWHYYDGAYHSYTDIYPDALPVGTYSFTWGDTHAIYGWNYADFANVTEEDGWKLTLSMDNFRSKCVAEGTDYCNELYTDQNTGLKMLGSTYGYTHILAVNNKLGYYDSCGVFQQCRSCTTASCIPYLYAYCDSTCYGKWTNTTCVNGNYYGTYSCNGQPVKILDCLGAGCTSNGCYSTNSNSKVTFSVKTHLQDTTLNAVSVNVTGFDNTGQIYSTSCTTGDGSCYISIAPGRWNVTGSLAGYITGAEKCSSTAGFTQIGQYPLGCMLRVSATPTTGAQFSLLAVGENENTTIVTINTVFRNEAIDAVNLTLSGYTSITGSDNVFTDNNGFARFIFIPNTNNIITITASKLGYTSVVKNYTVARGGLTPIKLTMDKALSLIVNNGMGHAGSNRYIDTTILSTDKISIPIQTTRPGTLTVSRDSVIVHPCEDWMCTKYKLQGLNVKFAVGPDENTGYILENCIMDNNKVSGDLVAIPYTDITTIIQSGGCEDHIYKSGELTFMGLNKMNNEMIGAFQFLYCTVNNTVYCPFFSSRAPTDTTALSALLDRTAAQYNSTRHLRSPDQTVPLGHVVITALLEALHMGKARQDVIVDYVIFKLNEDVLQKIILSGASDCTAIVNGQLIGPATCLDIITSPAYSPLVGLGYDPVVLDNGILATRARGDNSDTSLDSQGISLGGLEAQDWRTDFLKGTMIQSTINPNIYTYKFNFPLQALVQDVIKDINNNMFITADIENFDPNNPTQFVAGKTTADNFRIQTYLKFTFTPTDTNYPPETDYVRVDIPYRKNSILIWAFMIAGFIFIMFSLVTLSKVYKKVRRGK